MTRWRLWLTMVLVFALALAFGQAAPLQAGSIAASDGDGHSASNDYEPDGYGWTVDDGGGNQDVYYDPDAGPWYKFFTIPMSVVDGQILTLTEKLHVGDGPDGAAPAWYDYHEQILTPGWTWSPNGPQGEYPWGFTASGWDGSWVYVIPLGSKSVDWTFNPSLPYCTDLTITKYLVYNGPDDPTGQIIIAQYPTVPEPGTFVLLAMAGVSALLFVWRKRRTA